MNLSADAEEINSLRGPDACEPLRFTVCNGSKAGRTPSGRARRCVHVVCSAETMCSAPPSQAFVGGGRRMSVLGVYRLPQPTIDASIYCRIYCILFSDSTDTHAYTHERAQVCRLVGAVLGLRLFFGWYNGR